MVLLTIPSFSKNDHRCGLELTLYNVQKLFIWGNTLWT